MSGKQNGWRMLLLLGMGLLMPGGASAGPILDWWYGIPPDCSPGTYPAAHYCAPNLWKVKAHCFGVPGEPVSIYPSERCLPTPPQFYIRQSHCPYEHPDGLSDYGRAAGAIGGETVETPEMDRVKPADEVQKLPDSTPTPNLATCPACRAGL